MKIRAVLLGIISFISTSISAHTVDYLGYLQPHVLQSFWAVEDGTLVSTCCAIGDPVYQDKPLGTIVSEALETQQFQIATELAQLESTLLDFKNWEATYEVQLAKHQSLSAKSNAENACLRAEKSNELFAKGLISLEEKKLDDRQCQLLTEAAALSEHHLKVIFQKANPENHRALFHQHEQLVQRKKHLDDKKEKLQIKANQPGILWHPQGEKIAAWQAGTQLKTGDMIASIISPTQIDIEILVDEYDITRIKLGQKATATLNATQAMPMLGSILLIQEALPNEGRGGAAKFPVTLRFSVPADETVWRFGMSATVHLEETDEC